MVKVNPKASFTCTSISELDKKDEKKKPLNQQNPMVSHYTFYLYLNFRICPDLAWFWVHTLTSSARLLNWLLLLYSTADTQWYFPPGGGGHSHWKGVWGCAAVLTPFFEAIRCSLAYQFTVNEPLLWLPFSSFRNFLHFQPYFGQNSSSLDPSFSKFSLTRPPFSRKIHSIHCRPYILKPAWHTSTKKKLSALPGDIFHDWKHANFK